MIVRKTEHWLISSNSNSLLQSPGRYPDWTAMNGCWPSQNQKVYHGIWSHYHDYDEIWLFTDGYGEGWQDGRSYPITPNTLIYNPMGCVHRFQMRTESDVVTFLTPSERRDRTGIILVEEHGPPVPTVPGYVVPGDENVGPIPQRGPRCPLSELRTVAFAAGEGVDDSPILANEHWVALSGTLRLTIAQNEIALSQGDVALLRAGVVRSVRAEEQASAALARE